VRARSHVVASKLFGEAALPPAHSGGGLAARSADEEPSAAPTPAAVAGGGAPPQLHQGRLDAAAALDGGSRSAPLQQVWRQRSARLEASAGGGPDASSGLSEAAPAAPSGLRISGAAPPAAVVVGNPLQPPRLPHEAAHEGLRQTRSGTSAPGAGAAVGLSCFTSGASCPAVDAAVDSLSRELGVPPPALLSSLGVESLQRIRELWARAATPEARRLALMSTFWSTHMSLLPAAFDGVQQSPLPPAWLRLLHALEGAERDRHRVHAVDSVAASCRDEVAASCSESTPSSSAPPSPAAASFQLSPAQASGFTENIARR